MLAGTHDIIDITVNGVEVTTVYSDCSDAKGALVNFVFIDDGNAINFTRSALLALDRNISSNFIMPSLFPGKYSVLVYDIEQNGTLSNGVAYPAAAADTDVLSTNGEDQGKSYLLFCILAYTNT